MITLSFGYKKPQTGDKGSIFWPALEFDIQRLNDHTHDGINSSKIPTTSIEAVNQVVLAANWGAGVNGTYAQTIIIPSGVDLAKSYPVISDNTTGKILLLSTQILSATQFTVTANDNTLNLLISYV
jgi:hypothetical protein